jgi:hypothetical protein
MYACVHVRYVRTYVCSYVGTHECMYVIMYVSTYVLCIHVYVRAYT